MNLVQLSPQYFPKFAANSAVGAGSIYIGNVDTDPTISDNQKTVYGLQEDGTFISLAQPITLSVGGVPTYDGSSVSLYTNGPYSLTVLDINGSQIFYIPSITTSLTPGNFYYPDYNELDHGVVGFGSTIKAIVDEIGTTNKATIYFCHNSGNEFTDYILGTAETIPSNINLEFEQGARIKPAIGVTLTVYSPENIIALPRQQIIDTTNNSTNPLVFTTAGVISSGWFGMSPSATNANNTTYFTAAATATWNSGSILEIPGGLYPMNATTITVSTDNISFGIRGIHSGYSSDLPGTILSFDALSGASIGLSITNSAGYNYQVTIEDIQLKGPSHHHSTQATTTTGLKLHNSPRSRLNRVVVQDFYTGIHSLNSWITRYYDVFSLYCYYGLLLDTANNQSTITDSNFENNYCGIALNQGGGIAITNPQLESCTYGIYADPDNGESIRDLRIINPYFEGSTNGIVIGNGALWTTDGTTYKVSVEGGFWDSTTNNAIFRNVTDLWINVYEQYFSGFDFDATVYWTMPAGNHYSTQNVTDETDTIGITEFYTHADNLAGYNPQTLTLPPIANVPLGIDFVIKRVDAHANNVLIDANGAETIDGSANYSLASQYKYVVLRKDSVGTAQWVVVGNN